MRYLALGAILATTGLGGWTPQASAKGRFFAAQRSEPLTWDIYLLFLLRVLHELYGGDGNQIIAGMDPVDAMAIVTNSYDIHGSPPIGFVQKLEALSVIIECATMIQTSSHAQEPAYVAFMGTLQSMYEDVGGDPELLGP